MSKYRVSPSTAAIEVRVCQPQHDCPLYTWDREFGCMRVSSIYRAHANLPCDIASYTVINDVEIPTFLLTESSIQPETRVQARVLGAFSIHQENDSPASRTAWSFVLITELECATTPHHSLEQLSPTLLTALQAYMHTQTQKTQYFDHTLVILDVEEAMRHLREMRLQAKRARRERVNKHPTWEREQQARDGDEQVVAWRAIERLSASLRAELLTRNVWDPTAPHAQADKLIRYVPQRFQHALATLLLDDEQLLTFIRRPLLRHRTGVLGLQTWRSNEGLFLVTDRQILWLRDFLSPGNTTIPGGYIAHSAPLERLKSISLLAANESASEFTGRVENLSSPYFRLLMEVESCSGSELFVIEFPTTPEAERALRWTIELLHAWLPLQRGYEDRRVRRLPVVEAWIPQGVEAERLAGLGGVVPTMIRQQLEQRLTELLQKASSESLVSVLVPALEEYHSPMRLIALTRQTVLILEDQRKQQHWFGTSKGESEITRSYKLSTISSAQLRVSLFGSSLSLFIPQGNNHVRQESIPFHSPARAWFEPLFERLRIALSGPYVK